MCLENMCFYVCAKEENPFYFQRNQLKCWEREKWFFVTSFEWAKLCINSHMSESRDWVYMRILGEENIPRIGDDIQAIH